MFVSGSSAPPLVLQTGLPRWTFAHAIDIAPMAAIGPERVEEAERGQQPAAQLRAAGDPRPDGARPQPHGLQPAGRALEAGATEPAEQLLGAVPCQEAADDEPDDEDAE